MEVEVPASYPIVFTSTLSASGTLWAPSEHTPSPSSTRRRGRFSVRGDEAVAAHPSELAHGHAVAQLSLADCSAHGNCRATFGDLR